ncbi:MAG: zinc-ribbon domain-containing protein [Deltaproteobacteria bacterium]|nr:zinc-ribbon domain-containing protein [Deltaproteobacteria bacterium]
MKISCPACNAHYRLPDDRIQGKNRIFKIACKRCGAEIRVRGVETPDEVGRTTLPFALDLPEQAAVAQAPAQIWFAGLQGRQVGPLSEAEVIDHIATGRMGPEDPVWRKGFSAWTPVKDVPPFDDHVTVAPDVPADTAAPAVKRSSPRRAQTLELSAAMIELLVKLDSQQASEGDAVPPAEPPDLPPLDPEFGAKAAGTAAIADVPTTITASPAAQRASQPVETVKAAMVPAKATSSPKVASAAAAADEPPPAPAVAEPKRPSQPTEAKPAETRPADARSGDAKPAQEARESSIRIRLPEEAPPAKGRAPDVTKVALPGQASKADGKTASRTDAKVPAKGDIKISSGTPAMAPNVSGPVGSAARAAAVAANAAVATQPGAKVGAPPTQKSGGGAMIGIVLSVVFLAAVVTVFLAMSGKGDRPVDSTADAAAAVAAVAPDVQPAPVAPAQVPPPPAPAPIAPEVAVTPPAAEDAVAVAPAPDAAPALAAEDAAAAQPSAVAVKVDEKAAADKAAQDKAAQDKAAQDKAAQDKAAQDKTEADKSAADKQKADAERAAKDEAARQAAEKAKADKEAADKERVEKAAAAKAKADAEKAAKTDADKQAKAEKAAADAAKRDEAKAAAAEKAKKAAEDRAARDAEKAAARDKATADKKAAEDKKAQERAAASEAKARAAAEKKAAEEAKLAAAEAAKQKGNKPKISDEDVEELLRKHDKSKTAEADDGALTPGQVAEYGKRATKAVVNCYLLHAEDQGDDTIKVTALVNSSGAVERASVMGKHANNKAMAGCISEAVKKIVFPQSSGASKKYQLAYRVGG